jgi:proteic killer suppression protein
VPILTGHLGLDPNDRHRGLEHLFEKDDARRIDPRLPDKVRRVLTRLEQASTAEDMNLPGYTLHPLAGELQGFWSVPISGNWRVIFRIEGGDAYDVDLVDYH